MATTLTKLGTWGGVFGRRSKHVKAIADDLKALVVGLHPDTTIVPRKGDKAVSFGFGEKKMSESYCYLAPQTDRVNLGFWWGTALEDPNNLLEGTGKKLRHVKIFDQETARSAKIAHLVHLAMEERRQGLAETKERPVKAKAQTKDKSRAKTSPAGKRRATGKTSAKPAAKKKKTKREPA